MRSLAEQNGAESGIMDKLTAWEDDYYERRDHIYDRRDGVRDKNRDLLDHIVFEQPGSKYTISKESVKFLGTPLYNELCSLLSRLNIINNEYANNTARHVYTQMCHDEYLRTLKDDLIDWGTRYCSKRAKQYNTHDHNLCDKFTRLLNESERLFDNIPCLANSINSIIMLHVRNYIGWFFYRLVMGEDTQIIIINEERSTVKCSHKLIGYENAVRDTCINNQWDKPDWLLYRFRQFYSEGIVPERILNMSKEEKISELKMLAWEIYEIKPFLVRNYKPEDFTIEFGSQVLVWDWYFSDSIGVVNFYNSHDEAYRWTLEGFSRLLLGLQYDGVLKLLHMPWVKTTTLPATEGFDPIDVNLMIVREIHQKLLGLYDKVDVDSILNSMKAEALNDANDADTQVRDQEFIAATCQKLAKKEAEGSAISQNGHGKWHVQSVRLSSFLRILEKLGCEVGLGKGSEITVYRVGGKKCRIGRHKVNPYISSSKIGFVLKQLNIGRDEWCAAA